MDTTTAPPMAGDDAPPATPAPAPTDARPLVIDHMAAMDAINGMLDMLTTRSIYQREQDGDDPDFAAFAAGAPGLAGLATALHAHRSAALPMPPFRKPAARGADDLRAQLAVVLSDPWTPAPDIALSGEDMLTIVDALHAAVKAHQLPSAEDVTKNAAEALFGLADLAEALTLAARTTGEHVLGRVADLQRALGQYPQGLPARYLRGVAPADRASSQRGGADGADDTGGAPEADRRRDA